MIHVSAIDHAVLRTSQLQEMLAFYQEVLDCKLERSETSLGLYQLRAGSALIDIVAVDSPLGTQGGRAPQQDGHNMDHLCLRILPFDGPAIIAFLNDRGISHGGIERRYGAEGFGPSIYLNDPDGNRLELKGPPE
jgi:glyoxylase I family protein